MEESKNEFPLSGNPEDLNIFKNYNTVSEKQIDQWLISITTNGVEISEEQADRLIKNTHKAAQIAHKINKGPISGYENELTLRFPAEEQVGLMNDLKAKKELLNHDDESQTAAIIHEMIHGIEEEIPGYYTNNPQETIPLAAEFIFGGESRLSSFEKRTREVIACSKGAQEFDAHSRGWQRALQLFEENTGIEIDLEKENPEKIIDKIISLRDLDEKDKIGLIQDFIEQGKRNSNK